MKQQKKQSFAFSNYIHSTSHKWMNQKKMAKSDAWGNIKLCHLVKITLKDSNKLDWIKKGKVCYWEQTLPAVVVVSSKKTSPKAGGPLLCGPNKKGKVCYWESKLCLMVIFPTPKKTTLTKKEQVQRAGGPLPLGPNKKGKVCSQRESKLCLSNPRVWTTCQADKTNHPVKRAESQ